jgi:hypothetical protein
MSDDTAIKEALAAIAAGGNGILRPDSVVSAARAPDSPLHSHFEWDDTKAAAEHRLDQARGLIRTIKVVVTTNTFTAVAPAYIRDPRVSGKEQGYASLETLKDRTDNSAMDAIQGEFRRVVMAMQRLEGLAAAFGIGSEIAEIRTETMRLRDRIAKE